MHPPLGKNQSLAEPRLRVLLSVFLVGVALAALAGCGFSASSTAIQAPSPVSGTVHGGQKPVTGAKVQLYAAGTAGIGSAATPLLYQPVDTDNEGHFFIPASYDCPSASSQLYVVARGGNPGLSSGADNPAIALATMLGDCGNLSATASVTVNEVTTIGSVWPVASYMKSIADVGSTAGDTAFSSATSSIHQFIDILQGSSPGVSTLESYFAESAKLYSLADVLDKCVNSSGGSAGDGSPCGALFSMATPPGGSAPTDTMSAAMRIAQNPYSEVSGIYGLTQSPAAFQPALTAVPPDWTLQLSHPVATPVLSLATGSYAGSQTVTVTDATSLAKIYYTTDGTIPTAASSIYSGPIAVDSTSTVQAIAIEGISQSAIAASTLTITSSAVAQVPAKLAFLQQPSNTLIGSAISPAVRVVVQDANGNTVASATNLIRVNLAGVYGLGGTLEIAARNGVATFSNLTVNTAGAYTLAASSPGLVSAASTSFIITAAPVVSNAAKLVFLQQPSNTTAGATMAPPVRIALEDAGGNVVTTANNLVTLAMTGGAGLTGILSITPLDGVATFSNLAVNTAGSYNLVASSPGLASSASAAFTIISAPVARVPTRLAFLQQPSNELVGTIMAPPITLALEDTTGNVVTTATNPVSLALTNGTGLTGTLTVTPVNGVATFSDLALNTPGSYTFIASSQGLTFSISTIFTISTLMPPTPAKLVFLQQPSNSPAGGNISPALQVAVEDASGTILSAASLPITITTATNPTSSPLTGQLSTVSTTGIATFNSISVSWPGIGYQLQATSPGLTSVFSNTFTVYPLSPSEAFSFWQHPGNSTSPFNTPLLSNEHLSPLPLGFSTLQINLSSWFSPASSPGMWLASTTDPMVHVLFNLNSYANVANGTWKRQGNSATVEAQILASSSVSYPIVAPFALFSKYYYMTTTTTGSGWTPPMAPALNPQTPPPAAGLTIHAPIDASPASDSDGYFALFQPDGTVLECYSGIIISDGTIVCGTYNVTHSWSNLLGSEGGVMASVVPVYAGLIRQADIDSGAITHALNICISPTQLTTSYVSPAYSFDRTPGYSGTLPMGTRLAIPLSINLTAHHFQSSVGAMIATAAQTYGGFILDRGGPNGLTIRADKNVTDPAFNNPWDYQLQLDLTWILSQLQLVHN